jgi:hypothetical protein
VPIGSHFAKSAIDMTQTGDNSNLSSVATTQVRNYEVSNGTASNNKNSYSSENTGISHDKKTRLIGAGESISKGMSSCSPEKQIKT